MTLFVIAEEILTMGGTSSCGPKVKEKSWEKPLNAREKKEVKDKVHI
jgi:hypothetical protein